MIDYLTHYYDFRTAPFQSLSALPDTEAIRIMKALYEEDSVLLERFKDPADYLQNRRKTEQWVREQFILKGGQPRQDYPYYMVLGQSRWIHKYAGDTPPQIRIPISIFSECDVSFTYPDSMISLWFALDKPAEYILPEYYGKVFTLSEILEIVETNGMPEEGWQTSFPDDLAPYIEAQVWNPVPLLAYRNPQDSSRTTSFF